jgi:hypothetical protein
LSLTESRPVLINCVVESLRERLTLFSNLLGRIIDPEEVPRFQDSYYKWWQVISHEALARLLPPDMLSDCMVDIKKQLTNKCLALLADSE